MLRLPGPRQFATESSLPRWPAPRLPSRARGSDRVARGGTCQASPGSESGLGGQCGARGGARRAEADVGSSVRSPGDRSAGVSGRSEWERLDTKTRPLQRPPLPIAHALGSHCDFRSPGLAAGVSPHPPAAARPAQRLPGRSVLPGLPAFPTVPLPLGPHCSLSRPTAGRVWAEGSSNGEFEHPGGRGQACGQSWRPVSWQSVTICALGR